MCFFAPKSEKKPNKNETRHRSQPPKTNAVSKVKTVKPDAVTKSNAQRTVRTEVDDSMRMTQENTIDESVAEAMMSFVNETVSKGIEGIKKEFMKISQSKMLAAKAFKENTTKNRYSNIPCFDFSRVILQCKAGESDYIHANRFESKITALKSKFICTQAPTERSIDDFWRMIWQEHPKFIIMLCRLLENKKPKCALYWPEKAGESKMYGKVQVTNEGDGGKHGEQVFDIEKFRVHCEDKDIYVKHIRWLDWPDFGIPKTGLGMLRVLRKIEHDSGTAVVHCSAGIGRTGTLLAAEIIMKALIAGKHVKVPDVVNELRAQRYGMVQTPSQYVYLHFSICTYCDRKLQTNPEAAGHVTRLKKFFADYKDFANSEEAIDRKLVNEGKGSRNQTDFSNQR